MKSLEERHAEREKHRKDGPEPTTLVKDEVDPNAGKDDFELNEKEPMRNKAPGSSREPPFFEVKVVGDDSTPETNKRILTPQGDAEAASDAAAGKASLKAAKTSGGAGVGAGGGAGWKPNA